MAYINVNMEMLELTAREIDDYIAQTKHNMADANDEMLSLLATWYGEDSDQFKHQWERLFDNGSVYTRMLKDLDLCSQEFKYTAKCYKTIQENAIRRAGSL